ncbi:MAG: agmatinase [Bacteroidia bacterium]|nr:agmatinase [Bacteroidia bacterium]
MNDLNFGGISQEFTDIDKAGIIILPVPFDKTSTWIKGAEKGPEAILHASANMELYDIETHSQVYLHGIHTSDPVSENITPQELVAIVEQKIASFLQLGKFVVTIGGNHSCSIGAIYAHAKKYSDLTILQLDAHSDMRQEYENSKYNHACAMARAKEICPIVQVGIRSLCGEEIEHINPERTFFAHDIYKTEEWHEKAISHLSNNVYITIDLDVFDISIMPSTGTPEPGGLDYYTVLHFLKKVSVNKNIVGFDVVELCPNPYNKAPDFLAAKLIYQLLSYKFEIR